MANEAALMTRMVMRELGRRRINISKLVVRVSHGTVTMNGQISALRGFPIDLKKEMEIITHVLCSKEGIREVHYDEVRLRK